MRIFFSASLLQRRLGRLLRGREPASASKPTDSPSLLGVGFADIDPALEERPILDADARRGHIAAQRSFGANVHAIRGRDIAANFAQHNHLARGYVGPNLAVTAHGHAVAG